MSATAEEALKKPADGKRAFKPDPYKQAAKHLASVFIEQLGNPDSRWHKQWTTEGFAVQSEAYNPTTGKSYKGGNQLLLTLQQLQMQADGMEPGDNRWMTFKQAQKIGAHVRAGEKGTWLTTFKEMPVEEGAVDQDGNPKRGRLACLPFCVFHASQIEGLPEVERVALPPVEERLKGAYELIKDLGVPVHEVAGDRAFYAPSTDSITVPLRNQFTNQEAWIAVLLHEAGHATGHKSRLDRPFVGAFGSEDYAREELRAEIAAYAACQRLGVQYDTKQHFGYVNSWIKVLNEDPQEIMRAARDAEKIMEFLKVPEMVHEVIPELTPEEREKRIEQRKAEKALAQAKEQAAQPIAAMKVPEIKMEF